MRSYTGLYALAASIAPYVIAAAVVANDLLSPAFAIVGLVVSFTLPIGAIVLAVRALRAAGATAFTRATAIAALVLAIPFIVCCGFFVLLAFRRHLAAP